MTILDEARDPGVAHAITVPGLPGLTLISTNDEPLDDAILQQVVHYLEQLTPQGALATPTPPPTPPPAMTPSELKRLLRHLDLPHYLAKHWPAQHEHGMPRDQFGQEIATRLRSAIERIEKMAVNGKPTTRGSILRMRYIEGKQAQEVQKELHLSKSHFHRLQADGLRLLAELLATNGDSR